MHRASGVAGQLVTSQEPLTFLELSFINFITLQRRILLMVLIITQLVNNFLALLGTQYFVAFSQGPSSWNVSSKNPVLNLYPIP
jgi:hypothetical protein